MLSYYYPVLVFTVIIANSLTSFSLSAQDSDLLMTNSKPIDEERYDNIKGTPYLFEDWQKGSIMDKKGKVIENLTLNYNGQTNNLEVKQANRFIEVDPSSYQKVIVINKEGIETVLVVGEMLPIKGKFVRMVYEGKNRKIVQSFRSKIETKIFNNVGKNEKFESFYSKQQYYLIIDKAIPFKLKKKSFLPLLSEQAQLEQFLKKKKMKLNSEAQLIELMTYYENEVLK